METIKIMPCLDMKEARRRVLLAFRSERFRFALPKLHRISPSKPLTF